MLIIRAFMVVLISLFVVPAGFANEFKEGGKEVGQGFKEMGKEIGHAFKDGGKGSGSGN